MKEVIYLTVGKYGVGRMTKNLPSLKRGEIPVKLTLNVEDQAFREPVIEKHVHIEDWRQGVDIADVEFKEGVITEEEAQRIREMRLAKMKEIMEAQGYKVSKPEPEAA